MIVSRLLRVLGGGLACMVFLVPLANFALVACDLGSPPQSTHVLWNSTMDPVLEAPDGNYRYAQGWLWEPRPGSAIDGDVVNALGARGPETTAERGSRYRIAVIGDDQPAGLLLAEADSWPRQLENSLRAVGIDVEVLNFGVAGHTAVQTANRFARVVARYHPQLVLVACGSLNEFSISQSGFSDLDLAILAEQRAERLHRAALRITLFRTVREWWRGFRDLNPEVRYRCRVRPDEEGAALDFIAQFAGQAGIRTAFVLPLRRHDASEHLPNFFFHDQAIHQIARARSLPLIDLTASLAKAAELKLVDVKAEGQTSMFLDPVHVTARGSAAIGLVVALHLRNLMLVPGPAPAK